MCSSRKYPYPPHGRSIEVMRGKGLSIAKIKKKGKHGASLEMPEGWVDSNQKKLPLEGIDIFLNNMNFKWGW